MKILARGLTCSIAVLALGVLTVPSTAQEPTHAISIEDATYSKNPLFPGIETATLFGDRRTPGVYATHAKVSAGAMVPPHTHPNPLTTWVTSGTAYVGTGTAFDAAALKAYPTGTFFVTPAGSPHFIYAKDGAFSILDHGAGPSGFTLTSAQTVDVKPEPIRKLTLSEIPLRALEKFPGVSSAFLTGAFNAPGLYAAQGVMTKGSTFPPHSHPDIRLSVVVSGTMYLGQGEAFDTAKLIAFPAGSVAITPANTPHFMAAPDGDVRILEIGSGPSGATFFGG